MSQLLNNMLSDLDGAPTREMSRHLGTSEHETKQALGMAMPLILQSLARKSHQGKEQQLRNYIAEEEQENFNANEVNQFFGSAKGGSILSDLLGSKRDRAEDYISKDSGMSKVNVGKLLTVAAPLVLKYLAKRRKEQNEDPVDQVRNFERDFEAEHPRSKSVFTDLLDRDRDGDVKDDLVGIGRELFSAFAR